MPIAKKQPTISVPSDQHDIDGSRATATAPTPSARRRGVDWSAGAGTQGGGVTQTIAALRKTRGPAKKPAKEQVAIRLDPDVVEALRASGRGWQTRVNAALKAWLATQPAIK